MAWCCARAWEMRGCTGTHAVAIAVLLVFCSWGPVDAGASRSVFFGIYNMSQPAPTQPPFLDKWLGFV